MPTSAEHRVKAVSIYKELPDDDMYRHYWLVCVFEAWPDPNGIWRWMDRVPVGWPRHKGRRLPPDSGYRPSIGTIKYAQGNAKRLHVPYIPGLVVGSIEGLSDLEMLARVMR